jgi:hypothetical protein
MCATYSKNSSFDSSSWQDSESIHKDEVVRQEEAGFGKLLEPSKALRSSYYLANSISSGNF